MTYLPLFIIKGEAIQPVVAQRRTKERNELQGASLALYCFILFSYNQADRTVHHNLYVLCAETSYNRK